MPDAFSLVESRPRKVYPLISGSSQDLNSASTLLLHLQSRLDSVTNTLVSSETINLLIFSVLGTPGRSVFLNTKISSSGCCLGSNPLSSTSSAQKVLSSPRSRQPQLFSSSSSLQLYPLAEGTLVIDMVIIIEQISNPQIMQV